jgi:HEAT repeat protein
VLAQAFDDEDASVRRAALDQVLKLNFWRDAGAVIVRLDDEDAKVRQRAAQLAGELHAEGAVDRLGELLRDDTSAPVRQAAAWALGRIGGSAAQAALRQASEAENEPAVEDALAVAVIMARGE